MISNLAMQSAVFLGPSLPAHLTSGDTLRASVGHLLSRTYTLPCSTAAQAFSQLVQPTSRFQLDLDALLPLLSNSSEVSTIFQTWRHCDSPRSDRQLALACATHSCLIHSVFVICTSSDRLPSIRSNPFYSLHSSRKETWQSEWQAMEALPVTVNSWCGFFGKF
jgi:hypothetical protein